MQSITSRSARISSLIKGGHFQVGYDGNDFVKDRVAIFSYFLVAGKIQKFSMKFSVQMMERLKENELKVIVIRNINKHIQKVIFVRAFNMVKRLKRFKSR